MSLSFPVFQYYSITVGLTGKPFSVRLIKAHNGNGTEEILAILEKTAQILRSIGFSVRSYSFDGDRAYIKTINNLCDFIIGKIQKDLNLHIYLLASGFNGVLSIEDPLHVEKTE